MRQSQRGNKSPTRKTGAWGTQNLSDQHPGLLTFLALKSLKLGGLAAGAALAAEVDIGDFAVGTEQGLS